MGIAKEPTCDSWLLTGIKQLRGLCVNALMAAIAIALFVVGFLMGYDIGVDKVKYG